MQRSLASHRPYTALLLLHNVSMTLDCSAASIAGTHKIHYSAIIEVLFQTGVLKWDDTSKCYVYLNVWADVVLALLLHVELNSLSLGPPITVSSVWETQSTLFVTSVLSVFGQGSPTSCFTRLKLHPICIAVIACYTWITLLSRTQCRMCLIGMFLPVY